MSEGNQVERNKREGNLLASEPSSYLRQHANDPVQWHPWSEAAFQRAKDEQKPLLVSIGYASCHWCHVMARESFQDPKVAALMNEKFVNVKVDREERPDVDAVYMAAVQALTGHGGWPLTILLTPDGEPFYGGTYFPPEDRRGVPSFTRVIGAVADAWEERREQVKQSAQELTEALRALERSAAGAGTEQDARALAEQAAGRLAAAEDPLHGGFGDAPKFPPHESIRLLLHNPGGSNLEMALRALRKMAQGGIRDHLGGGYARYSVDAAWRVPHFEMMLYDNAAMLRNYAVAYAATGDVQLRDIAYGVAAWLMRELAFDPAGDGTPLGSRDEPTRLGRGDSSPREIGFFNALDADQDGEEGAYYVWSEERFLEAAGQHADLAAAHFGVTTPGQFEGMNVLHEATSVDALADQRGLKAEAVTERLAEAKASLLAAREKRTRPAVDDKAMASWNGLALGALATAGRLLADSEITDLARANARYLRRHHWHEGKLWHVWRQGQRSVEGLLEDYAYVGLGLLDLYRATFEKEHLEWALELARQVSERFHDPAGGYFSTATNMQRLVVRPKGYVDAATPSENAAAAELVWWAARYLDRNDEAEAARAAVHGLETALLQAPQAFASSLRVMLLMDGPQQEVLFSGSPGEPSLEELVARWRRYDDGSAVVLLVTAAHEFPADLPLAEGRALSVSAVEPERSSAAYVCTDNVCSLPLAEPEAFERALLGAGYQRRLG